MEGYLESAAHNRLARLLEKNAQTIFIGALSSFEESYFGKLWGFGLAEDQLTEQQRKWRLVWERLRSDILDKGNGKKRGVRDLLLEFNISLKHED